MKATWNGATLAESDQTVVVEGNHYFPADAINREYFTDSSTHTTDPWKGEASYNSIVMDGTENKDAALVLPDPEASRREYHRVLRVLARGDGGVVDGQRSAVGRCSTVAPSLPSNMTP